MWDVRAGAYRRCERGGDTGCCCFRNKTLRLRVSRAMSSIFSSSFEWATNNTNQHIISNAHMNLRLQHPQWPCSNPHPPLHPFSLFLLRPMPPFRLTWSSSTSTLCGRAADMSLLPQPDPSAYTRRPSCGRDHNFRLPCLYRLCKTAACCYVQR